MSSSSFLVASLGFSVHTSFPVWISFIPFSLIIMARTSKTMLINSGESGHPCLVPDLKRKCFQVFHHWQWCLLWVCHIWPLLCWGMFPLGFPGSSVEKNPPANAGDLGSIPDLGKSPGGGNGNPFQYFLWTEEPGGLQFTGSERVMTDMTD